MKIEWLNSTSIYDRLVKGGEFCKRHTVDLILLAITIPVGIVVMLQETESKFAGAFILMLALHQIKGIVTNEVKYVKKYDERRIQGGAKA